MEKKDIYRIEKIPACNDEPDDYYIAVVDCRASDYVRVGNSNRVRLWPSESLAQGWIDKQSTDG